MEGIDIFMLVFMGIHFLITTIGFILEAKDYEKTHKNNKE